MTKLNYISQLTFLRFIAASLIVIFHFGNKTFPFNYGVIREITLTGAIAVSFFFFLSGLVLTINYFNDKNLKFIDFLIKRIARIYPVYLFSFLITLVLTLLIIEAYPGGLSIILQLLCFHAWNPGTCHEINFPGWSLSVEMFFYLTFPLIVFLFRKLSLKQISLIVVLIWGISFVQNLLFGKYLTNPNDQFITQLISNFPLWHLNTFLFGMMAGLAIMHLKEKIAANSLLPLLFHLTGFIILLIILGIDNIIRPFIYTGLLSPIFFMITVGLTLDNSIVTKVIGRKELVYLGDISYSLYILQYPVYLVFSWFLNLENVNGVYFYPYFFVLIVCSALSFRFIETKLRKLIVNKYTPTSYYPPVKVVAERK